MTRTTRWVVAWAAAAVGGCTGTIGEGEERAPPLPVPADDRPPSAPSAPAGAPGTPPPPSAGCAPAAPARPAPAPLPRLTQVELENTVRDLFGADALAAMTAAVSIQDARAAHEFGVLAQGITSNHVVGYHQAADVLAAHLTASPQRLAALSPCLTQAPVTAACVRGFVERTGRRVFRRPLAAEEVTAFLEVYGEGQPLGVGDGVRLVLFALLQSPHFLYRPEILGAPVAGTTDELRLTSYELATRLSYLAWGSTPDERLLDAAAGGRLDTEAGLASEVDRLLDEARARPWVERFFGEWLEVDQLPPVVQSDAFLAGISRSGLASDMRRETLRFALTIALDGGGRGTYRDLLTSTVSFVPSANLAKVYGVAPAAGDGRVALPTGQRDGILTRAALLLESEETTSPIVRGALVRRKLLCAPIDPPDPSVFPPDAIQPPPFDPSKSARDRWTAATSAGVCGACHRLFNPLGFALENYDPIGRYRTTEPIIDPRTNRKVNELPIDATVEVPLGDRTVRVNGAVGLGAALAEEPTARRCFAEQWVKYAYRRPPAPEDACLIAELAEVGAAGGIRQMFRRSALMPGFRVRRAAP